MPRGLSALPPPTHTVEYLLQVEQTESTVQSVPLKSLGRVEVSCQEGQVKKMEATTASVPTRRTELSLLDIVTPPPLQKKFCARKEAGHKYEELCRYV